MDPLISIIIPIYNMEEKLGRCMKSIFSQSNKDFEVLLINDGSTDNSGRICNNYASNYNNVFVFHKTNGGVSSARNLGLKYAKGNYVMFVDPDDWLDEKILEVLVTDIEKFKSDISICCALVHKKGYTEKNSFFKGYSGPVNKKRAITQLFSNSYYEDADRHIDVGVPWGKLYRKKFLKENKLLFNLKLRRNQDNIFNLYCFEYAKKITYIDSPLYNYELEHFHAGEKRSYMKDAIELYSNLGQETLLFYKTYYNSDQLLFKLLLNKLHGLLGLILRKQLCHPKMNISIGQRINYLQILINKTPFELVIDNRHNNQKIKTKIIIFLLRKRQYKLVVLIYYFGFKLGM